MAANKLADQPNYSWKTTVVVPESSQFKPGPAEGRTEKGGFTYYTSTMRDNKFEMAVKGTKTVVTSEGEWKMASDLDSTQGAGRFISRIVQNFKAPAAQAIELANTSRDLKKDGDTISGDLTEDGAKAQLQTRGDAKNAMGSVKFWVKDGVLTKYEIKVKGKIDRNGNEVDIDRATTVEIKDVGATKVEVPEAAKKKLS